jgi:hypothetical protein
MKALGPYEILGELGRGGMGTVFRARHAPTGALRAVKVMNGVPDPVSIERFRREARALAKLDGRGVVTVHEMGVEGRSAYFVMDIMPGGSLRARLRAAGRLGWREAASLVAKLARTLARSHGLGLVHRDVKPDNVLFDELGEPRLADWGCVRDLGASVLTVSGASPGTTAYMAPEQHRGEKAGPAADVFALGVLLHELLTGVHPYPGAPLKAFQAALASDRVPASRLAATPGELDATIDHALAPDPARRASADELAQELEAIVKGARRRSGLRSAAVPASIAAAIVAAVGAGAWVATTRRDRSSAPVGPATHGPRTAADDDLEPLERDAAAAVTSIIDACAEETPLTAGVSRLASEANRRLRLLAKRSTARCHDACAPLARAAWLHVRAQLPTQVSPTQRRREAAIRETIEGLGAAGAAVDGMLQALDPYDPVVPEAAARIKTYEAALAAVAPIQSLAAAELEQRLIAARAELEPATRHASGMTVLTELRDRLEKVRAPLEAAHAVADDGDRSYIERTLETVLRDLASHDETLADHGAGDPVALLGDAIARLESSHALAFAVGQGDFRALAVMRFKRIYACRRHDPPLDTRTDVAALEMLVHAQRFGELDDIVEAALLRLGGDADRARARDLTDRACRSDRLGDRWVDAVALKALLMIDSEQPVLAHVALDQLDDLRRTEGGRLRTFIFGISLEQLDAIAREKLPGRK